MSRHTIFRQMLRERRKRRFDGDGLPHFASGEDKWLPTFGSDFEALRQMETATDYIQHLCDGLKDKLNKEEYEGHKDPLIDESIDRLTRFFMLAVGKKKLTYPVAKAFDGVFSQIRFLTHLIGEAESRETSRHAKRLLEYNSSLSKKQIEEVSRAFESKQKELETFKKKFHQSPDESRDRLFKKAVESHHNAIRNSSTKRGYTWTKALEDANSGAEFIPSEEFQLSYIEITNHFKKWRNRNKRLIAEIEERLRRVTKKGTR